MAAGEYISVASQRDTEAADVEKERIEQEKGPAARARELDELVQIYIERGLEFDLARQARLPLSLTSSTCTAYLWQGHTCLDSFLEL